MWNSKKLIKFAHLQKLANQSILNKAHVIEITNACIVAFMKARNSSAVWCKEKKTEDVENVVFEALAQNFLLTSKNSLWPTFYQMDF